MIHARRLACCALAATTLGACSLIEIYPDLAPDPAVGGGGGAGGGGGGAGGGVDCIPQSTAPCYDGPPGTQGVGACVAGVAECLSDGSGYGPCVGQTLPSAEDCASPVDEDCDGTPMCDGALQWDRVHGGSSTQRATAIAADGAGNVWATGSLQGAVDLGGGPLPNLAATNLFFLKLSPSGDHLFSAAYPDAIGRAVAVDAAGGVALAVDCRANIDFGGGVLPAPPGNSYDLCVVKLTSNGQYVWARRFGDNMAQLASGVAIDPAGRVAVVGSFAGTMTLPGAGSLSSAGALDAFIVVLDPGGNPVWGRRFGAMQDQALTAVAFSGVDIVVAGTAAGTIDLGGGQLPSLGGTDIVVAKLTPSGDAVWSHRYGSTEADHGLAVAVNDAGDVVLAGSFRGAADFGGTQLVSAGGEDLFLRRMTSGGVEVHTLRFGDGADQAALGVDIDGVGNVVLTGRMRGTVSFGGSPLQAAGSADDVFLAKLTPGGAHVWSRRFGDAQAQLGAAVALDGAGSVLLAGEHMGVLDLGAGPHPAALGTDLFLARFSP